MRILSIVLGSVDVECPKCFSRFHHQYLPFHMSKWEIKYKLRLEIQNTDVLNALIYHHLKNLTEDEVLEYRRKILGKDE